MKELNWNEIAQRPQPNVMESSGARTAFQNYPASKQGDSFFFILLYKPVLEFRVPWGGPRTSIQVAFLTEQLGCELSAFNTFSSWGDECFNHKVWICVTNHFTQLKLGYTQVNLLLIIKCSNSAITFFLISFIEKTLKKVNGMNNTSHLLTPPLPLDQEGSTDIIYSLNYFSFKIFLNPGWYLCGGMLSYVISIGISLQVPCHFWIRANIIVHLLPYFHQRIPRDALKG